MPVVAVGIAIAVLLVATAAQAAETVKVVIEYGDGTEKHFTQLEWKEGLTVLEATQLAEKHPRGIKLKVRGSGETAFVTQIDEVTNEGSERNWVFRVNGKLGDRSSGILKLNAGDTVLWRFQKYE